MGVQRTLLSGPSPSAVIPDNAVHQPHTKPINPMSEAKRIKAREKRKRRKKCQKR